MRLKPSNPFAELFSNKVRVDFVHSGKPRVRFFENIESAKRFAGHFKQAKIVEMS